TPLAPVRAAAAQPLALAPANEGLGLGYKILALAVIGGGVALYLRKKKGLSLALGLGGAEKTPSKIDILGKSSVGVRSQLLVVEVEGTRLLVGMTATSIATLAVLQTPDDDVQPTSERSPAATAAAAVQDRVDVDLSRQSNLSERVRSLLGSDEPVMPRLAAKAPPKPRATRSATRSSGSPRGKAEAMTARDPRSEVAGQARGLLLSDEDDS
ncbi:MAG: hypothetical protein JWP97_3062, partial [Labilithrix sp.]|nr:hypothetical protein [Labilithrix sp.]